MAQGTIAPAPKHQFFTNAGLIASGYKLFTYSAGTTNKLKTYTESDLSGAHENANPIVLDSAGRATIFLQALSYKFVMALPTDTDPPASPIWTVDNVSSVPAFFQDIDVQGTAGEAISAGDGVYMSAGDGALTAGRWYRWSSSNPYSSSNANAVGIAPDAIASGVTGSIRIAGRVTGLSGLIAGTPYYIASGAGLLTATGPSNTRTVGVADSSTTLLLTHTVIPQQDVMGQAGEDLAIGDCVYLSVGAGSKTAGRWYKADSDDIFASVSALIIGITKVALLTGATGPITTTGRMGGFGFSAGALVYVDSTAGALTAAPPANARAVGIADSNSSVRLISGHPGVVSQRKVKTSNEAFTSPNTTVANVPDLVFNIGASEVWSFRYNLLVKATAAVSLKFHITVPSAVSSVAYGVLAGDGSAGSGAALTTATTIDAVAMGIDEPMIITGIVTNGANAGAVQLQWAQNAASSGGASSTFLYANSYLLAERVFGQP